MTEVHDYRVATVDEAAAALRAGAVTSAALTRACLDQVGRHDSRLNAFVTVMEESALAASEVADRKLEAGQDLGPFHGIPVAVKDLIDVCGVHTTCGSPARAKDAARTDALVVRRLRDAGAVIIGKTNLIELAYIATHPRFRRTNNPWDPSRVSGASSGGSAVAVATGMCFAALEKGLTVPATAYIRAQGFRRSLRTAFMKVLDETDLLVSPTCARVAPEQYEGSTDGVQWTEVLFTQPFNQTGLPALSVPCALSAEGLPIGLQIASRPHAEALVLGAGAALEAALGRFAPPLVRGWTTTEG